jgi:hypothetical protein
MLITRKNKNKPAADPIYRRIDGRRNSASIETELIRPTMTRARMTLGKYVLEKM